MAKSLCTGCGATFASVTAFDRHRVGAFETIRHVKRGATIRERSTRRCLSAREMQALGMERNGRGWWTTGERMPSGVFTARGESVGETIRETDSARSAARIQTRIRARIQTRIRATL
jgi:hypothetical protein